MDQKETRRLDDYISPAEREHLLNGLHRYLIWVGETVSEEVEGFLKIVYKKGL